MAERRPSAQQKALIVQRAGGCCEYCLSQDRFSVQPFSVEHIIPQERGGKTVLDNLALACQGCNNHKYTKIEGRDPVGKTLVPLYHPRHQHWRDHFAWNDDFTLIIGLTPTGRATIDALQLNRERVRNLRWALRLAGQHPPVLVEE